MTYAQKKTAACTALLDLAAKGKVSLKPKFTSHFFRSRTKHNQLDLTHFDQVLQVDVANMVVEVEGMTTFYNLAKETLKFGCLPAVVPELRNITIGGTISGLGIEASSFKYGMVHNAVLSCDVLTSSGEVVTCSRTQNADLFYLLPNSIGSVGYVLKCQYKLQPAKQLVQIKIKRFTTAATFFVALEKACRVPKSDFLEGVVFGPDHFALVLGTFADKLPPGKSTSSFLRQPFWRFLSDQQNSGCWLTTWDYLWRWDRDAFWAVSTGWMGKVSENLLFRETFGRYFLRSHILGKLNHLKRRYFPNPPTDLWESIIQDVCIDLKKCPDFFKWYQDKIAVYPLWICPASNMQDQGKFTLHDFTFDFLIDIGIYTGKKRTPNMAKNAYNRMIEHKILEIGGMKGLYSESYYTTEEFWQLYSKEKYFAGKTKYDPRGVFPSIYDKTVGKKTL